MEKLIPVFDTRPAVLRRSVLQALRERDFLFIGYGHTLSEVVISTKKTPEFKDFDHYETEAVIRKISFDGKKSENMAEELVEMREICRTNGLTLSEPLA